MALDGVKNFAIVTVSTGYDDTATSIVLATGDGAKLPDPATANYNLVWWDSTNYSEPALDPNVEIVRCTAKSTDTLTVTRAQESTSGSTKNTVAATYKMALTVTAKMITDIGTDLDAKVTKALFDANTILAANSDNTPAAVTIAEQRIVSRLTGGNIAGNTIDDVLGMLTDTTTNNVSTSKHGLVPKAPNDTAKFLRGDATWAIPTGANLLIAVKSADESLVSSSTYQDDDHLTLSIEANSNYIVELHLLIYQYFSNVGLKLKFIAPNGATLEGGSLSHAYSDSPQLDSYHHSNLEVINDGFNKEAYSSLQFYYKGVLFNGQNSGTFKLQWAQVTSNSYTTKLKKGSSLKLTKV